MQEEDSPGAGKRSGLASAVEARIAIGEDGDWEKERPGV